MEISPLEHIVELRRAVVLLQPLRLRILSLARQPVSASELGRKLGLSRQKVNYHVSALAAAGFLRPAGTRRRRNLVERRYQASARSYALHPSLLGPLSGAQARETSATVAATSSAMLRAQAELAGLPEGRTSYVQLSRLAFARAAACDAFRRDLGAAIVAAVRKHTTAPGSGPVLERWNLILALYPADPGPPPATGGDNS